MLKLFHLSIISILLLVSQVCYSQVSIEDLNKKIEAQNNRINYLSNQFNNDTNKLTNVANNYAPIGIVLFLFGGFCALWAQNTQRNAWLWFFFGLILNVIAVITLLIKNAGDLNSLEDKINDI
ncbi:MAG: hypothetical protein ABIP79_02115 [Chitinophagaceae bacterium]